MTAHSASPDLLREALERVGQIAEWIATDIEAQTHGVGTTRAEWRKAANEIIDIIEAALQASPAPLDAAWAEAEAALPEGWRIEMVASWTRGEWRATAVPTPPNKRVGRGTMWLGKSADGPTPVAALHALAARLQSTEEPRVRADDRANDPAKKRRSTMAKGKPGSGGTIAVLPSSSLVFGGHVDYSYAGTAPTGAILDAHWVITDGGRVIEAGYASAFRGGIGAPFVLGPTPSWSSSLGITAAGSLSLGYFTQDGRWHLLASTTFAVAA